MTDHIQCDYHGCSSNAECHIRWGNHDRKHGNFCQEHIDLLWRAVNPAVAVGISYWIQTEPKK